MTGLRLFLIVVMQVFCMKAMAAEGSYDARAMQAISNKDLVQAEKILRLRLQQQSGNLGTRFQLARVLSWQGRGEEAMVLFDTLLEAKPGNADYLLARANTLEWLGRRSEALRDLKTARRASPDYSEIWRTEIKYLRREHQSEADARAVQLAEEARKKFPQESWQHLLITSATKIDEVNRYGIQASYGYDRLTSNRSPWNIKSLSFLIQTPDKRFASLQLDQVKRFDLDDWQIGGNYALPFAQSWYLYAGGTYSQTHNVLANRMLEAKLSKNFSSGLNLHVGVSHAKYSQTDNQQLYMTGEYYWSVFRASYSYRLIDVKNAGTGSNNNIQISRYYDSVSFIGALVAKGEDVEFDGSANPPISDVLTFSIFGSHLFRPQWSLVYSFTYHQQGDFYNRNGFVLGLKFDF